ncbi:MAG: DUF4437 domain-containing protein [Acidobacteriia bacterium]|nr:DUF4437 domain-containing protein [Terriglobia bacterium]
MNRIASHVALSAAIVSMLALPTVAAERTALKPATRAAAPAAVLVADAELKWTDVPEFPGVKMARLHGDPNMGPSHFFLKLPSGFAAGMHFHNADHWVAVVSGTLVLTPEGGAEKKLPAGSGFGFTGKKKHTTKCAEGSDCVLFIDARGKWDVIPTDKK